jgi:Inverse autotransporter, beta-domain
MFRRFLISICCAVTTLSAYDYHVPHVDFDTLINGYRTSGGGTLFFPFGQVGCNTFFGQGSIGRFKSSWVGNLGGGYRLQMAPDFGWGVNAFFDYAYSEHSDLSWFGGGVGLELFGSCWEARLNGYVPQTHLRSFKRLRKSFSEEVVIDNHPTLRTFTDDTNFLEGARWGVDGEAGAGVCVGPGSLWAYIGYFRFQGETVEILQGPRARLEYKLPLQMGWGMPELWFGVEWQRDEVYKSKTAAVIHVQVPLYCQRRYGRCPNLCTFKRMGNSVRRQNGYILEVVAKSRKETRFTGLWFIREGAMGVGTQLDPTSVGNANTNSLPGDFIFPLGPQNIDLATGLGSNYTLKPNQTMVSFGDSTQVTFLINGVMYTVFDITGSGRGTLIQTNAANAALSIGSNTVVQGIGLIGGLNGIVGTGVNNTTITDVRLTEQAGATFAGSPILLTNPTGTVAMDRNFIQMTTPAAAGIELSNGAGQTVSYSLTNNMIISQSATPTRGIGITISDSANVRLTAMTNMITGFNLGGIVIAQQGAGGRSSLIIEQNTISNIGSMAPGIGLATTATASNSQMSFRVSGNTTTTTPGGGINMDFSSAGGAPVIINGAINDQNGINGAGAAALSAMTVVTNFAAATDLATILVDDTRFQGTANISFGSLVQNLGVLNLTLTNNTDGAPGGAGTVVYDNRISGTGTYCLTMTGNNTTRTKPAMPLIDRNIQLVQTAGTFNVTDLAGVVANNNGMTANVVGTVNSVTAKCPIPVVP